MRYKSPKLVKNGLYFLFLSCNVCKNENTTLLFDFTFSKFSEDIQINIIGVATNLQPSNLGKISLADEKAFWKVIHRTIEVKISSFLEKGRTTCPCNSHKRSMIQSLMKIYTYIMKGAWNPKGKLDINFLPGT